MGKWRREGRIVSLFRHLIPELPENKSGGYITRIKRRAVCVPHGPSCVGVCGTENPRQHTSQFTVKVFSLAYVPLLPSIVISATIRYSPALVVE